MSSASVLVGVPDLSVDGRTTWEVNKIGGSPDLMVDFTVTTCVKCLRSLVHIMQIYCPLESSPFHRTLHIFVCTNKSCWNKDYSWKVYRSQLKDTPSIKNTCSSITSNDNKVKVSMETNSWCDGADDWGDGDNVDDAVSMVSGTQADNKPDPSFMVSNSEDGDNLHTVSSSQDDNNSNHVAMVSYRQGLDSSDNVAAVSSNEHSDSVAMVSNNHSADNSDPVAMVTDGQVSTESPAVSGSDDSLISDMEELDVREDTPSVVEEDSVMMSSKEAVQNVLSYLAINTSQSEGKTLVSQSDMPTECSIENPDPLDSYYLNVFEEPACEDSDGKHAMKLLRDYERKERVDVCELADREPRGGGSKSGTEKYEKSELKHGDRFFHKFIKTLKRCPEQVVRYHYGGSPLLIRDLPPGFTPPPCPDCRAPRQFELQLVPSLIPHLRGGRSQDGPVVEFGTVLVYSCSESCWDEVHPTPREEFVTVQSDPDQYLFKT